MSRRQLCIACGAEAVRHSPTTRFSRCPDCTQANAPYSLALARRARTTARAWSMPQFGDYDPIAA
jgi:hypothetical protein